MTVPFAAFLASVSSASYRDYAGKPGTRVRDEAAFQQMRQFLLVKYQGTHVIRSFTDEAGGGVFDCVEQPGAESGPAGLADSEGVCREGSIPTRRITLADLVRFPTLRDFLAKAPDGSGQLPMPPPPPTSP